MCREQRCFEVGLKSGESARFFRANCTLFPLKTCSSINEKRMILALESSSAHVIRTDPSARVRLSTQPNQSARELKWSQLVSNEVEKTSSSKFSLDSLRCKQTKPIDSHVRDDVSSILLLS